jgi:hypothetical protein
MNMSYCQFENTLRDLRQCLGTLERANDWEDLTDGMHPCEIEALEDMPKVLAQILNCYDNL